jgi:hypothetical protein
MTQTAQTLDIPTAWNVLHASLAERRPVRARYHGRLRVLCPHAIGWKNGRAKVLVFQTAVIHAASSDPVGWRSMFVDEIEDADLADDSWQTAHNYTPHTTGIDTLSAAI